MPDNRPQYDDYKRPSPVTCLVGVIVAFLVWAVILAIVFIGFPDLRATLTYPLAAIALLILVVGGGYYLLSNRRRRAEHEAQKAQQMAQRAKSDAWVAKEQAESTFHSTSAAAGAGDQPDEK